MTTNSTRFARACDQALGELASRLDDEAFRIRDGEPVCDSTAAGRSCGRVAGHPAPHVYVTPPQRSTQEIALVPAERLGDLYSASQHAAGALSTVADLLCRIPFELVGETPTIAGDLKAASIRLEHALTACVDVTESEPR